MKHLFTLLLVLVCTIICPVCQGALYQNIALNFNRDTGQYTGVDFTSSLTVAASMPTYRIFKLNYTVTNRDSIPFYDIKFTNPDVEWAINGGKCLVKWSDADGEWKNDQVQGSDGSAGISFRAVSWASDCATWSRIAVSQTGLQSMMVLPTDQLLFWNVVDVLLPGQSVSFTYYMNAELPAITQFGTGWDQYMMAAIPEPTTMLLLGLGGMIMRKRY